MSARLESKMMIKSLLFLITLLVITPVCFAKTRSRSELLEACMAGLTGSNYRVVTVFRTGPILKRVRGLTDTRAVAVLSDQKNPNGSHSLVVRPLSKQALIKSSTNPVTINENELIEVTLDKWDYAEFRDNRTALGSVRARLNIQFSDPPLREVRIEDIQIGTVLRMESLERDRDIDLLVVGENPNVQTSDHLLHQGAKAERSFLVVELDQEVRFGATSSNFHRLDVAADLLWYDGDDDGDSFLHVGEVDFKIRDGVATITGWKKNNLAGPKQVTGRTLVLSYPRLRPKKTPSPKRD